MCSYVFNCGRYYTHKTRSMILSRISPTKTEGEEGGGRIGGGRGV